MEKQDTLKELIKANATIETMKVHLMRCAVIFSELGDDVSASNARSWAQIADDRSQQRNEAIVSEQLRRVG